MAELEILVRVWLLPPGLAGAYIRKGPTISELFGNADMGPYGNLRIRNMNAYAREMARHHKTRADERIQREKAQIRLEIDATSTAKLAPPLSETELIQALVSISASRMSTSPI